MKSSLGGWRRVVHLLRAEPPGVILRLPKGRLPHPRTFRMTRTVALPEGQTASYRKVLRDGAGLMVADFDHHYEIRIEMDGAPADEPASLVAGGTALGALVGSAFGRTRDGVLAAAAVGGLLAALLSARAD
jgi:hypothetical protein